MQKTILIVDDEEMLRLGLVRAFKNKGFNVLDAGNAKLALDLVKGNNHIDLVISDICMPEENGITLLEKIRTEYPKLPVVIFMTGFSDFTEEECVTKGAKTVFKKPFKIKELVQAVNDYLA